MPVPKRMTFGVFMAPFHRVGETPTSVTHDQTEAMTMADKIVVMQVGNVGQVGAPLDLSDRPDNLFVAGFIGSPAMNFVRGRVARNGAAAVVTPAGETIPAPDVPGMEVGRVCRRACRVSGAAAFRRF